MFPNYQPHADEDEHQTLGQHGRLAAAEPASMACYLMKLTEGPGIAGMPMFLTLNRPIAVGNLSFSFN